MKKTIFIGLLVFILTASAILAVSWFIQASSLKSSIENSIASLHPDVGTITVDSIETTGFPLDMKVTLVNPRATFNTGVAFSDASRKLSAEVGDSAGVLAPPRYPESTIEITIDGMISLTTNALSNHMYYEEEGPMNVTITKDGQRLPILFETAGVSSCDLHLETNMAGLFSQSWDIARLLDIEELSEVFRSVSCQLPAMMALNAETSELLYSQSAGTKLKFAYQPGEEQHNVQILLDGKEVEFYPAGDEMYAFFSKVFTPEGMLVSQSKPSLYGKQTFLMDIDFTFPADGMEEGNKPFHINMKQLAMSNNFYQSNMQFDISSAPRDGQQNIKINIMSTADFSDKHPDFVKEMIKDTIEQLGQEPLLAQQPEMQEILQSHDKNALAEALFQILPNTSELGTLTQKIQAEFSGTPHTKEGTLKLTTLELSSNNYGIYGQGEFNMDNQTMMPIGSAGITCKNCEAFIDTLSNYAARVELALAVLNPQYANQPSPREELVATAKQLVTALGTPGAGAPENLEFIIQSQAAGITINGKNMMEIMMLMAPPPEMQEGIPLQ